MMRYLKILFLSFVVIGLMSGSAFAGTIGNATGPANTAWKISTEVIGASGLTIATNTTTSGTVFYKATNAFVANDVVTFTFANVGLTGASFNLCRSSTSDAQADYIGAIDATNGVSSLVFRAGVDGIPAASELIIVEGACAAAEAAYATGTKKLSMKFPVLAAAQSATVSAAAVFGTGTTIPGATATAVNLYTVANQYSATAPALVTDNIDFDSDMKKFLVGTVAGVLDTGNPLALASAANDVPYTLLATDKVGLTLSGSMDGVSRICFNDATCLAASTKKFTINTTTNTATYDVTTVGPAIGAVNLPITFVADGITPLTERTFTLAVLTKFAGATTLNRTLETADPYFKLALDAWQAKVPFVKTVLSMGTEVYVKLTSTYISTGTSANKIKATVFCADKTTQVVDVATITPGVSSQITGEALATAFGSTCVTDQMKSDGYPVTLTVNAPLANVSGYGSYASGTTLRALPIKVKQSTTPTSNWNE
jgi:hypothetical protein